MAPERGLDFRAMDEISPPRALREDERALLDHLLSVNRAGFEQLREQSIRVEVVSSSLWLIELRAPRDTPASSALPKPVVSRAVTRAEDKWADATLWIIDDGYLNSIEIMWPDGAMDRLPRPDELGVPIPSD
jgi:hypothetical protein